MRAPVHEGTFMRILLAGLAGTSVALAAFGAMAQDAAPAAAAPAAPAMAAPATPAAAGKPSVETTTIGDLIANDKTKAVLAKDYAGLLTYDGLDQIKGMTLRDISKFPQAQLDDAKLAVIQKDFDAIPAS
jgi:hypothetical protein